MFSLIVLCNFVYFQIACNIFRILLFNDNFDFDLEEDDFILEVFWLYLQVNVIYYDLYWLINVIIDV